MTKKKPYKKPQPTANQRIKIHIKEKNQCIIDFLKVEMKCNHQWVSYGRGFKCENCDYYTGMDTGLNQLINKTLKK